MNEFYKLIQLAKQGDQDAMMAIIDKFSPLIGQMKRQAVRQDQEDLEQEIVEKVISVILSYDMESIPNFSEFCRQILTETASGTPKLSKN